MSATKSFTIPRNTILSAKKTLIISPKITNFSIEDKSSLKLMTSQGELAFDYSSHVPISKISLNKDGQVSKLNSSQNTLNSAIAGNLANNLLASSVSSNIVEKNENNKLPTTIFFLALFVFVGVGAGAVYFIRRKKVVLSAGNDFEILDE